MVPGAEEDGLFVTGQTQGQDWLPMRDGQSVRADGSCRH